MKFSFNVNLTDEDYLEYNKFCIVRSPYGKKQITTFRTTIAVIFSVFILISLLCGGFSLDSFIKIVPLLILLIVFELCITRFFAFSIKSQIKVSKKSGKLAYSPSSVIEFYDDKLIETTADNKVEQQYSAIERISIVDNKMIYIQVNNAMAFILPISCFESKEQFNSFFEFTRTKFDNIDIY